jgi:hypothetical protein
MPNLRSKNEIATGESGLGVPIQADGEKPSAQRKLNLDPPENEAKIAPARVEQKQLNAEQVLRFFSQASENEAGLDPEWVQKFMETAAGSAVLKRLREHQEACPEPEQKRQKLSTPPAVDSQALRELGQQLQAEELSLAVVDDALMEVARVMQNLGGQTVKRLFRFAVTSTASHFPANWDRSAALRFKHSDTILCELRAALGLVAKLERPRGPANGGLVLANILELHAESAMQAAWRILADTCLTVKHGPRDYWWPGIVQNVRRFSFHARSVLGDEYALLVKLEGWLMDNTSPRSDLNPPGDKLMSLRDIIFPTDPAELGGEESFDAYGLRELDLGDFAKLNHPGPAREEAPTPPQVLPEAHSEPQTQNELGPDVWIQKTLSRMTRDELLAGPSHDAEFFMNSM